MDYETRLIFDGLIRSLETEPERWKIDEFTADRDDGYYLWHTNRYYGVEFGYASGPYRFQRTVLAGGVTGWSTFFGWLTPWRRQLVRAVRAAQIRKAPTP